VQAWFAQRRSCRSGSYEVAEPNPGVLRQRLVVRLRRAGTLSDPVVERAFLTVPRELFVATMAAREGLEAVYRDDAIVIKQDAVGRPASSSSQPSIMAIMLEQLQVRPGQRVLEVGAGSGYNAALLSILVGPGGRVISVELDEEVARSARAALAQGGYPVQVVTADGRQGWAAAAPFDRIIVTASTDDIPRAWFDQLAVDGCLVLPLRFSRRWFLPQAVVALRRTAAGLESVAVVPGAFMALRRSPGNGQLPGPAVRAAARRPPGIVGSAATGALGSARWRLLQVLLLLWQGLTAPLAWLPRLGDLRVTVTFAEYQEPRAGVRLHRDEGTIFVQWRRRDRSRCGR
jgi:protein-L-isoaspartate(D-aspartate) O-methyltransferase